MTSFKLLFAMLLLWSPAFGDEVPARAIAIPKETTSEGSGYFSIIEGLNHRLYIGAAKYGQNAYLVEFDHTNDRMSVVVDAHKEIGTTATGFAAQSKFHTRNNVGPSGKIYVGTKQGYPKEGEKRSDYPGGYPMVYDPKTGKTRVYPIPVPHHGIISITPDEARGIAYISTCDDARPIESTHFMILDLEKGTYRELLDCRHMYAFIVVDYLGRAYHPILGGKIARFEPGAQGTGEGKLRELSQVIDGTPLETPKSIKDLSARELLANPESHPINWDITRDGKTLYSVAMSGNQLFRYDLTECNDQMIGKSVGNLLPGNPRTDCRGMCVGPTGTVWAAVWGDYVAETGDGGDGNGAMHLVSYKPGDPHPTDHGMISVTNPDFTEFVDGAGKPLPNHHGFQTVEGKMRPLYHMGICEGSDGIINVIVIAPYTLLRIDPKENR